MSICNNFCSALKDILIATVLIGICKAQWLLPHRPETAPPRVAAGSSLPFNASIILLVLIVAAVGATSFLHFGDSRDSTLQPTPLRSAPTVPSLPWQCLRRLGDTLTGWRPMLQDHAKLA